MSVISLLIIEPEYLPSFEAVKREAETSGGVIELHEPVDLNTHTGFLSVRVHGRQTGFEYYFEPIAQGALPPETVEFGTHHIVTRTGSDFEEGRAALLFLQVAAKLSGGAYAYPDDAIIVPPQETQAYLVEQVREYDAVIQDNDEKAAMQASSREPSSPPDKPRGLLSRLFGKKD